jgi:hypothetical protein
MKGHSMTPMVAMSQAIRLELEKHGGTIREIPDGALRDFHDVLTAYRLDLADEMRRRKEDADATD